MGERRPSKRGAVRGRLPAPDPLPILPGERGSYRQAALELHAAIRNALAWIEQGAEPAVAHAQLLKAADDWKELLEEEE